MPKATLIPCPDCGESGFTVFIQELSGEWRGHCGCGHATRYCKTREAAISAWNSLPRALRWTHEPPKMAGWYWWRTSKGQNVNTIHIWSRSGVLGYYFDTEFITALDRGEWAGPIVPPIES